MAAWGLSKPQMLVCLVTLIVGSIGAGYVARRRGLDEAAARRLMYGVVLGPYTLVGGLAIWALDFRPAFTLLPVIGIALMAAGLAVGAPLARRLGLADRSAGAFVLAAGASNLGFTMGGFVSYVLFGEQGLAVAAMYTIFWNVGLVLLLYPVARHYGHGAPQPLWRLVAANFVDVRSLPLASVLAGLALNLAEVPRPGWVADWHVVDVGIVLGSALAFFTTGVRLHLGGVHHHGRLYAAIAAVKFLFVPLAALVILGLLRALGRPLPFPAEHVVLVQATTPAAIYAVVISTLFGLDDRLASVLFVVNTAVYVVVVLPLVVMGLG